VEIISSQCNDRDASTLGAFAIPLIQSDADAAASLNAVIESLDPSLPRVSRSVKLMLRKFVELCGLQPPENCKFTAENLAEREKWGRYMESRDAALALFGTTKQARDTMKRMFYNNGSQTPLRDPEMIQRDILSVKKMFQIEEASVPRPISQRETAPLAVLGSASSVPPHLYDPAIYNPYPHCCLTRSPLSPTEFRQDFFPEIWNAITDPMVSGPDDWYLRDAAMYSALMRCLIHRLDWEAMVELTIKSVKNFEFSHQLDAELLRYFSEIGDAGGCVAFKVATKLYDGRINVELDRFKAKL
jgi:hypothetical protein